MRNQIKFIFQIGMPSRHPNFENGVALRASRMCGGCTTSLKTGYWMADGAEKKQTFIDRLESEVTFEVELTCEPHKAENVYVKMSNDIAELARSWGVMTDWVHVSEIEMKGRHFSVSSLNETLTAA